MITKQEEEVLDAWHDHREHCMTCDSALMSDELCVVGYRLAAIITEQTFGLIGLMN